MTEKYIENSLVKRVEAAGGLCFKFVSPGMAGVPDRIALLPDGKITFVEVKAPGKKPRKLQAYVHGLIRALGFRVLVIDSIEGIAEVFE